MALFCIVLLIAPFSVVGTASTKITTELVTVKVFGKTLVKEIEYASLKEIVDLGLSCKEDFMTIFYKQTSQEEVTAAFTNVSLFFQTLVDEGFAQSTEELTALFYQLRDRIREPRPQHLGMWNGLPTPLFGNTMCGIASGGYGALGFCLGTHMIFPTIGIDLANMWIGAGETMSVGLAGFTTSTGPEFGITIGFVGILIATPLLILGPYLQVGFAAGYIGVSPAPFS